MNDICAFIADQTRVKLAKLLTNFFRLWSDNHFIKCCVTRASNACRMCTSGKTFVYSHASNINHRNSHVWKPTTHHPSVSTWTNTDI